MAEREYIKMGRGPDGKLYIWKYLGDGATGLPLSKLTVKMKEIIEDKINEKSQNRKNT